VKRAADTLDLRPSLFSLSVKKIASEIDLSRPESQALMRKLAHTLPDAVFDAVAVSAGNRYMLMEYIGGFRTSAVAFSQDGAQLAFGTPSGGVFIRDLKNEKPMQYKHLCNYSAPIRFVGGAAGKRTILATTHQDAYVYDALYDKVAAYEHNHGRGYTVATCSYSGKLGAMGRSDRIIEVRCIDGREEMRSLAGSHRPSALVFSADDTELIVGSPDGSIRLWSIAERAIRKTLEGQHGSIHFIARTSNEQQYIAGSNDEVRLWSLLAGNSLWIYKINKGFTPYAPYPSDPQCAMAYDIVDDQIAVQSSNGTVEILDGCSGASLKQIFIKEAIRSIAFNYQGNRLVVAGGEGVSLFRKGAQEYRQAFQNIKAQQRVAQQQIDAAFAALPDSIDL